MKIELKEITIKELTEGYTNNDEEGVIGYGGKLDIRPKYQREFVYEKEQRDAVINTVRKEFPLNVMYWAKREDGNFEIIDGQQRTISICKYVNNEFSFEDMYFHNRKDIREQILNYKLMVYICSGTENERLDWFKTINIAGEKLTDQELRNAVYAGSWLTEAKRYFSKSNCVAHGLASNYMNGSPIRQEYLETVIDWISEGNINEYMAMHQHDVDAKALWNYFVAVIEWVQTIYPHYRREMKGIGWGFLYNKYKDEIFDPVDFENQIVTLMMDEDVTNKKGIYKFLLTKEEKYLNIRAFTDNMKREAFERQEGVCTKCKKLFEINKMDADHILPWSKGGKTNSVNCQMLCVPCNRSN